MKKVVAVIGFILAAILIIQGCFVVSIPSTYISPYGGYTEYVGGDAYNIQIEASLRAGEYAGAMTSKAIYISSGVILLFLTLAFCVKKDNISVNVTNVSDGKIE